jgi:glycine dehydrogenase subunit 1
MRTAFMSYIPNTDGDLEVMLKEIGVNSPDELFSSVPGKLRFTGEFRIPEGMSEMELLKHLGELSSSNASTQSHVSFLGGGTYNHYVPSLVGQLSGRSEFYTSYTPYQPEISQGTLQAIFEYQSLMCMLTNMDVSNASLYDGASAAAEAVLMSLRTNRRNKVIISRSVNPEYRKVINTYLRSNDREIIEIPVSPKGVTDIDALTTELDESVSCVVVQYPNYFGILEDLDACESIIHETGALFVVTFSEPLAFGVLRPPGEYGADIVCGEGQSFGIPLGFGGPYLGILTAKKQLLRTMPGRIVGKTIDRKGATAYVLTLTAREQHIRREKATSNICTNQGLCALTATIYLAALGKRGFRDLAILNHERSEYARRELAKVRGIALQFDGPTFNEFVIQSNRDLAVIEDELIGRGIIPGIALGECYDELRDCMLVSVTEMNSTEDIDRLCDALGAP